MSPLPFTALRDWTEFFQVGRLPSDVLKSRDPPLTLRALFSHPLKKQKKSKSEAQTVPPFQQVSISCATRPSFLKTLKLLRWTAILPYCPSLSPRQIILTSHC